MFIQTETTPNPATLKFLPGETVLGSGTADFPTPEGAAASPLARRIFAVPGVAGVFLGSDFVTVTKSDAAIWDQIKPSILGAIMDALESGQPLFSGVEAVEEELPEGPAREIKELIGNSVAKVDAGSKLVDQAGSGLHVHVSLLDAQRRNVFASTAQAPAAAFERLAAAADAVRRVVPDAAWMSAGMSGDFAEAIAAGATHLRIGTAITGPRPADG